MGLLYFNPVKYGSATKNLQRNSLDFFRFIQAAAYYYADETIS